jgi:hypothetical protein
MRIGSRGLSAALFAGTVLLSGAARADVSVGASLTPQRAQVGEALTLAIDVSGAQDVAAPTLGSIDGFDVRYVGPSTQISIVNGRVNASVQHRYSLMPLRSGHFTLGPFTLEYQGRQYQTQSFGVDVVAAGQPLASGSQGGTASGGQGGAPAGTPQALRLTLATPLREVYLHERVPVDVTLYVGSVRVADLQYPTLPGDGLSVDKFPEPSQRRQTIGGETFQVVHFQTTVIPMRTGSLTIGPATLRLNVLNRRRGGAFGAFNDPFFERFFGDDPFTTERRPLDLRSDALPLNVLPLPEAGRPPGFSGAVGSFTMDVTAAPTQLTAGDPVTVRMKLTGTGNLSDATPPELTRTDGFRTYEPRAAKSDGSGTGGVAASKSFEQVLIANDATVRAVPPVRFSYFDPQTHRYQTLESQPIALVVRPPQHAPRSEIVAGGPAVPRAAPEEKLGRDIVYIKDDPGRLVRAARGPQHVAVVLWSAMPPLLFLAAAGYDRHRQRLRGDLRYARFTRAGKRARDGLARATQALTHGDRQTFYDVVSRTMQEYLAAKLDLPPGGIDATAVTDRGVPDECVGHIRMFFATCEQIRFAPTSSDGDMRGTLSLAQDIVKRLERERRLASAEEARGAA